MPGGFACLNKAYASQTTKEDVEQSLKFQRPANGLANLFQDGGLKFPSSIR